MHCKGVVSSTVAVVVVGIAKKQKEASISIKGKQIKKEEII